MATKEIRKYANDFILITLVITSQCDLSANKMNPSIGSAIGVGFSAQCVVLATTWRQIGQTHSCKEK